MLGNKEFITLKIKELGYDETQFQIVDPLNFDKIDDYVNDFYALRQRKGITMREARELMSHRNYFGSMMVRRGEADSLIGGLTTH